MEPAVGVSEAEGRSWRAYETIEETAHANGQGAVWVLKGSDGRVTARERADQFAATFQMTSGCALDAEEDPILPRAGTARGRLHPPPASGPPELDPSPTANADELAMFRPSRAVPAEYQPGGCLARASKPQVCAVVWASGVEVEARDIRAHQPTLGDEAALQGAARLLCLHETFHSYVDQALLRYQTLTGREPVTRYVSKEEALANAFAARNVDGPLAAAQVAIAEEGDLVGYAELACYLRDADFTVGLLDLGRSYFGDEYAHLILDVVEHDDASNTAIAVGLPGDQRRSAYQAGAWNVDPRDYNQVIDELPL